MSNYNINDLNEEQKRRFVEAQETPRKFGEILLVEPESAKPFKANFAQQLILGSKKRDVWVCVSRRAGKELPLYSKIYTPSGSTTMQEVYIGQEILTPDGSTSKITHIIDQGHKDIYKITLDDGTSIEAGAEHEWEVYAKTCRRGPRGHSKQLYDNVIKTTKEIADNLTSNSDEFNYKLNGIQPVQHSQKDVSIDPYLFGVLLGDGHFKTRTIVSADPEIIETIQSRTNYKYKVSEISGSKKALRYHIISDELLTNLWGLGLKRVVGKAKHIPEIYKYGSVEQRLWLIRGLMDTDGSSDPRRNGQAEYCSMSAQLATDVAEVLRSLGCKVRVKESVASYTKNGIRTVTGTRFRVTITVPEGLEIFNLERKKCGGLPARYLRRTIINIEKLGQTEMRCISIDHPKHLFLIDNYTPTHNCITGSSRVLDPRTLRPIEIYRASHLTKTLCFDFKYNKLVWSPCRWVESGYKACIRLCLGTGVDLTLTKEHQVFDWKRGWIPASELKVGDRILAPSEIAEFGDLEEDTDIIAEHVYNSIDEQEIPDQIFLYTEKCLATYLKQLWQKVGGNLGSTTIISYMVWNKYIALDLHHLFLKIGIETRIDDNGNLHIEDYVDRTHFLAKILDTPVPVTEVRSLRRWEIVTNIYSISPQPVYDLIVEHHDHNFLANDTIVHNSYALSLAAIFHAATGLNKKVVVFASSSPQIIEFFGYIDKWIRGNPVLKALQASTGNHSKPYHVRTFKTGSTIAGHITGLNGVNQEGLRGITADVVLVDEAATLDDDSWKVIGPIMKGDRYRAGKMKCYVAGTIKDPVGYFYEKILKSRPLPDEEVIYLPITKNPDYTEAEIEALRQKTPIGQWTTEYLLEIAEAEANVFRKADVEQCSMDDWEYGPDWLEQEPDCVRFMGVDWDKVQAGTNIAVFSYNPLNKAIRVIYREEVARDEFSYMNAMERIIELYQVYQPELVITDQGQGEMQYEYLQLESQKRGLDLAARLVKKAFNEKVEVPNPQTGEMEKKLLKPFLVGHLQRKVQEHRLLIPHSDDVLVNQLISYKKIAQTANTIKFSSTNEHVIDCCSFAMYGIWWLYENELEEKHRELNSSMRVFKESPTLPRDPVEAFMRDIPRNSDYGDLGMVRTDLGSDWTSVGFGQFQRDDLDEF